MPKYYTVQICFAKPMSTMSDDGLKDLKEATKFAACNLLTRHHVELTEPMRYDEYCAALDVKVDNEKINSDNLGMHLKGISMYLLKKWSDKYMKYKDGTRLLYFDVIPEFDTMVAEMEGKIDE